MEAVNSILVLTLASVSLGEWTGEKERGLHV